MIIQGSNHSPRSFTPNMLPKKSTNIVAMPIARPFIAEFVTARVGQSPSTSLNGGISCQSPFVNSLARLFAILSLHGRGSRRALRLVHLVKREVGDHLRYGVVNVLYDRFRGYRRACYRLYLVGLLRLPVLYVLHLRLYIEALELLLEGLLPYPVAEAGGLELLQYFHALELQVFPVEPDHEADIALETAAVSLEGDSHGAARGIDALIDDELLSPDRLLEDLEVPGIRQDYEYRLAKLLFLVGLYHGVGLGKNAREHGSGERADDHKVEEHFNYVVQSITPGRSSRPYDEYPLPQRSRGRGPHVGHHEPRAEHRAACQQVKERARILCRVREPENG